MEINISKPCNHVMEALFIVGAELIIMFLLHQQLHSQEQ